MNALFIVVAAVLASSAYLLVRNRINVAKLATVSASVALVAAFGLSSTASATVVRAPRPVAQAPLSISNTVLTGTVGSAIALTTTGGSGTGAVTFSTSTMGCSVDNNGNLSASSALTCTVKATKAASTGYNLVNAKTVKFVFSTLGVSNSVLVNQVGTSVALTTTGGPGTGAVFYSVTGAGCSVSGATLTSTTAGSCDVVATKAASIRTRTTPAAKASTSGVKTFIFKYNHPTYTAPDTATLTSISGLSAVQSTLLDDTVSGDTEFINNYWGAQDRWLQGYTDAGATVKLTWHVTGSFGQTLANQAVTLVDNPDYGCQTGITWTTTSLNSNPGCGAGAAQGALAGTTDANGNVSFTLTNSVTGQNSSVRPTDLTTAGYESQEKTAKSWTRVFLQIGNDTYTAGSPTCSAASGGWGDACKGAGANQTSDLVDLTVVQPVGYVPPSENPTQANPDTATLVSATGLSGNVIDNTVAGQGAFINQYYNYADTWGFGYVPAGATVTLKYKITGSYGQVLANQPVTFFDNQDYSGSNGTSWTESALNANPLYTGWFEGGALTGTTDANGFVTFTLHNTNTLTGAAPSNMSSASAGQTNEANLPWTRTVLQIGTDSFHSPGDWSGNTQEVTGFLDLIVIPSATAATTTTTTPAAPAGDNPTNATPDVAALTSITGAVSTYDDSSNGCAWWLCGSWMPADKWTLNYVAAGSAVTENWHVTGSAGQVLANQTVTLILDQSGGDNNFTTPGQTGTTVTGTTDANGNVSFTLTDTDSATGLICPDLTANANGGYPNANEGPSPWARTILIVGAATGQTGAPYWNGNNTDIISNFGTPATQATDNVDLISVAPGCGA